MTGWFSAGEIASIQRELDRDLPDSCQIMRLVATEPDDGGWEEIDYIAVATVACRVAPARSVTAGEGLAGEQLQRVDAFTLTLPANTDIRPSDRVTLGDRTFEVSGPTGDRSVELNRRVAVIEINHGEDRYQPPEDDEEPEPEPEPEP